MEKMFSSKLCAKKELFIINGYKFSYHKMLENEIQRRKCTNKNCRSFYKIDALENMICEPISHNHDSNELAYLKRQKLKNQLKRKAITDISMKPSKLICTELSGGYITSTASNINLVQRTFTCLNESYSKCNVTFAPDTVFNHRTEIKGCRFHLGQSWWRKVQNLGLANEYKYKTETGLFLRLCFGLLFLPPKIVCDVFTYKIIPIMPAECLDFTDYILENYKSENTQFPPISAMDGPVNTDTDASGNSED
ncbi:hypothetical protein QTP88_015416 [Uroleucon formosanum]